MLFREENMSLLPVLTSVCLWTYDIIDTKLLPQFRATMSMYHKRIKKTKGNCESTFGNWNR